MPKKAKSVPKRKALDKSFVEFVVDQIGDVGDISHKYMFGGCAIYRKDKVVALICDNKLYVRPTEAGRVFLKGVEEEPPYPGAKPHFLIEDIENGERLCELIRITDKDLPKAKKG